MDKKNQETKNTNTENMETYHRFFISSLRLLLDDIVKTIPEGKSVRLSSSKLIDAIESNNLDAGKISSIVKKVYTILGANLSLVEKHDEKIFYIKETKGDKTVIVTVIPGINIGEAYELYNSKMRETLWKYMDNIFYATVKLLELANPECLDVQVIKLMGNLSKKIKIGEINEELQNKIPTSKLIISKSSDSKSSDKEEFNPFIGVGKNNENLSVEDMAKVLELKDETEESGSKLGGLGSIFGVDKLMNLDKLSEELKNIDKSQIDKATEDIKKLMGGNIDSNTSEMINMMLHDITDELKKDTLKKGNPIDNIVKIAETVAQRIAPKIDPKKINTDTIQNFTKNMAGLGAGLGGKGGPDMMGFLQKTMERMENAKKEGKSMEEIGREQMQMSLSMFNNMGVKMTEEDMLKIKDMKPEDMAKVLQDKVVKKSDSSSKEESNSEKKSKKKKK